MGGERCLCPRLAYGIQEVARSIRVSSTNKITHYLALGEHRTAVLSENCPNLSRGEIQKRAFKGFRWMADRLVTNYLEQPVSRALPIVRVCQ